MSSTPTDVLIADYRAIDAAPDDFEFFLAWSRIGGIEVAAVIFVNRRAKRIEDD